MAIGGFNGTDPSPTLEEFQSYVAAGEIPYFLEGGGPGQGRGGFVRPKDGWQAASQIAACVADNFTPTTIGGVTVYDLTRQP